MGRATASARWAFLGLGVKVIVQGVAAFAVARLVGKDVYGVISIGLTYVYLTALLLDQGMGQALIRATELRRTDIATVQVTTVVLALAAGFVTWGVAAPIGHFYNSSGMAMMLIVLGFGLVLRTPSIPGQAVLQREFHFRWLAGCDMVSSIAGVTAGVITAKNNGGPMTLPAQMLVTDGVYSIGVVMKSGAPFRGANLAALRGMLGFTAQIAGSQWLGFVSRNVDNLLIGKVLGAGPLGAYSLSYRFMMLPITNLAMVANRVLLPTYSRLQDDASRFKHAFLRSTRLMSLAATAPMALLLVFAEPLIVGLLKPQYRAAVVPTQVLALVSVIQAQTSLITPAIVAFGRTAWQLKWNVVSTLLTVVMFAITVEWGLNAVCIGYLVLNILTLPVPIMLVGKLGGFRWKDFLASVSPGLGVGAIAVVIGVLVRLAIDPLGWPLIVVALAGGAITTLLCIPVVRILMPRATLDLLSLASRGSSRRGSETPAASPAAVG